MNGRGNMGFCTRKMGSKLISFMRETQEISMELASLKIQEREKWQKENCPQGTARGLPDPGGSNSPEQVEDGYKRRCF